CPVRTCSVRTWPGRTWPVRTWPDGSAVPTVSRAASTGVDGEQSKDRRSARGHAVTDRRGHGARRARQPAQPDVDARAGVGAQALAVRAVAPGAPSREGTSRGARRVVGAEAMT